MTFLKKLTAVLAVSLPLAGSAQTATPPPEAPPPTAAPAKPVEAKALGLKLKFTGDLNHRANVWTNQAPFYSASETIGTAAGAAGLISKDQIEDSYIDFKYRFNVEAGTEDNNIRGVYGIEIGGTRFGDGGVIGTAPNADVGTRGGSYSGDGDNYETRFAYLDFAIPAGTKTRLSLGLMPFTVNKYIWQESATAIQLKGAAGPLLYTAAWVRTNDFASTRTTDNFYADGDHYYLRGDFVPVKDTKLGVFGLYQHRNTDVSGTASGLSYQVKRFGANTDYDLYNLGVDGALKFGDIFVNGDFIYQLGNILTKGATAAANASSDVSAFFAHADVGINLGPTKVTYTGWYASGDDDLTDNDVKNFMTTDVDMTDSIILFEDGGFYDESYFTEAPGFLQFGAIFNKLAVEQKVTPKLTLGAAVMYIMTAEDLTLVGNKKTKNLGTEIDASISYKLYSNLELAVNAGYLIADDGMDAFEQAAIRNGKSDADIFRAAGRVRYMF